MLKVYLVTVIVLPIIIGFIMGLLRVKAEMLLIHSEMNNSEASFATDWSRIIKAGVLCWIVNCVYLHALEIIIASIYIFHKERILFGIGTVIILGFEWICTIIDKKKAEYMADKFREAKFRDIIKAVVALLADIVMIVYLAIVML